MQHQARQAHDTYRHRVQLQETRQNLDKNGVGGRFVVELGRRVDLFFVLDVVQELLQRVLEAHDDRRPLVVPACLAFATRRRLQLRGRVSLRSSAH